MARILLIETGHSSPSQTRSRCGVEKWAFDGAGGIFQANYRGDTKLHSLESCARQICARVEKRFRAHFVDPECGADRIGYTANLSIKGVFVEKRRPVSLGRIVDLVVELPDGMAGVHGVVAWTRCGDRKRSNTPQKSGFGPFVIRATFEWFWLFLTEFLAWD